MKKSAIAICALSVLTSPALCDVFFDGATNIEATQNPYFSPEVDPATGETGARYGIIGLQIQALGQKNDGYITPFVIMFPQDDYSSSIRVRLNESQYDGSYPDGPGWWCPELSWRINTGNGWADDGSLNYAQQKEWDSDCAMRPDPSLYNSGVKMGLEVSLQDDTNNNVSATNSTAHWMVAQEDNFVPMDGGKYFVMIFYSTGTLWNPPWIKFFLIPYGWWSGTVITPTYVDSSYYYMGIPDGFSVPMTNMLYQLGCETVDTAWVDSCYSGILGTFYFHPDVYESEVIPYNARLADFITYDGKSVDYKIGCTAPLSYPPMLCNQGGLPDYLTNSADIAAGLTTPQLYTVNGWTFPFYLNPSYGEFLGGNLQDAGDNFH